MSDLTNTPKREPAYGKAARRFGAEQALGRKVVDLLRDPRAFGCYCTLAGTCLACRLDEAARSLGLIDTEANS